MIAGIIISSIIFTALLLYIFIRGASNYSPEVRKMLDDEQMFEIAKIMKNSH